MRFYAVVISMLTAFAAMLPAHAAIGEGRQQPIRAIVNGVPIMGYGTTYVDSQPPDLVPAEKTLQAGNENPVDKMHLKKSWEIKENHMGANPPNLPRTDLMDRWQAPLIPIHLIDNDP